MIDGDPKVAKELGVEVPKDPALTKAEQAEAAENDAVDGLDAAPSNCAYLSLHKLLCLTNLPEPQLFNMGQALFLGNCERFRRSGHASASNFPGLCDNDGLWHHPSEYRVFARVSGNVGATNGLHARRLAALRCASPRRRQDRCLLTAKYFATKRTVPRGF